MFFPDEKFYKEIMPYDYYTSKRYLCNIGVINEAFKDVHGSTIEEFKSSLTKSGALLSDTTFDMYKYALYYCKRDVQVL